MSWQGKGKKAAMGQFVRIKAERMVIVRFDADPVEVEGQDFNKNPRKELHFPVSFWDERSVAIKYKEGEAARLVMTTKPEAKMLPAGSPILMRSLLEEDEEESIMGRTFIISHTGASRDTEYRLREIRVPRQSKVATEEVEEEEANITTDDFDSSANDTHEFAGPNPRKEPIQPPTRKRRVKKGERESIKPIFDEEGKEITDPEKLKEHDKFMKDVKKRAKKVKDEAMEELEYQELEEATADE